MSDEENPDSPPCPTCGGTGWLLCSDHKYCEHCPRCSACSSQENPDSLVIDALKPYETFRASDGYLGVRTLTADDLIRRLGIPEDMTVAELQDAIEFWQESPR
jgi:hypothetical protein